MVASCARCGKQEEKLQRCAICKEVWYCGPACQKAAWKGHKKICEPWVPPLPLEEVTRHLMTAATAVPLDWQRVLKWEGRMEELMIGQSDAYGVQILSAFKMAHLAKAHVLGISSEAPQVAVHVRAFVRIEMRRIELLGEMKQLRDQGNDPTD